MKKGLLLASCPPNHDGLTKIEFDVLKYNKNVIDFDLACDQINDEYDTLLKEMGVKTYILKNKKNPARYMQSIFQLVKRQKYDFVYIHGNSAMMVLESLPAKLAKTNVITHCHNTKSNYPFVHKLVKPLFNKTVDVKIGCSSLASQWAYLGKGIYTIVNGIDIKRFRYQSADRDAIRTRLGWQNKLIVGNIGRFSKQKNHRRLIEIFDELCKINADYRLLLIGEGELREDIQQLINDKGLGQFVDILDYTDEPEKYLSAMDILVMPSLFEGLGLVALEAQANGLPVLIDTFFPPETSATENCERLSLSDGDHIWAAKIDQMVKDGRREVSDELYANNLDQEDMMKAIQRLLLK
jgi:glycosyltransferase involved in cell wall biosynthesis